MRHLDKTSQPRAGVLADRNSFQAVIDGSTPHDQANTGIVRRGGRLIFFTPKKLKSDVVDGRSQSVKKHRPEKQQKATSFSLNVPEMQSEGGLPAVYKLYYDNIYIINKGKTLSGSLFLLQRGLGYYLAYEHNKESVMDKDYWFKFYDFVRRNPGRQFRVEIVMQSNDALEILKSEQATLDGCLKDKKCFNGNIKSYIPTLNAKTGMHGWITPDQVSRFYESLTSM